MKHSKEQRQKLRLILAQAHRQRQDGPRSPGPAWRGRVMSRLPKHKGLAARLDQWALMDRLVWRLVPAAGALALLLVLLVSQAPHDPAGDLASALSSDTADGGLYAYYQSESGQ